MGQMEPQPKKDNSLDALYFFCNIHASCVSPFIRSGFGKNALGWNGVLAFCLLWYMACTEKGMNWYFAAWFIALIYRRIETFRMLGKGQVIHSRYSGYPWLAMKVPFVRSEQTAQVLIEPMMCLVGGVLLAPLSTGMGGFVLCGTVSLLVRTGIEALITEQRLDRMRDSMIEQAWYAEEFRKRW
jgi:hypothetical protein